MKSGIKAMLVGLVAGFAIATTTASANHPSPEACCEECAVSYGWSCIERCIDAGEGSPAYCRDKCNRALVRCSNWCGC
jgi:hypothetical protein